MTRHLFSEPPSVGRATSEDAADAILPHLPRLRTAVLRRLRYVDATADELEDATGLSGNTVRPRLRELEDAMLIERTGATRPTRSGRGAMVWRMTDLGRRALEAAELLRA